MTIGFIGLGNMGGGMVKNLLTAGFGIVGFDVDGQKLAVNTHERFDQAASIADVGKRCETIVLCLPDPETSRSVIFEELLKDGSVVSTIIETSTLTPEVATDFMKQLDAKGIGFLSCPMIGGRNHAENGTIEFLAEGPENLLAENRHILEAMGSKAPYMGEIPSGTLAKLAFNLSRFANLAVGVETHRLLEKYAANIPAVYELMSEQSLDNFGQVWREDLKGMMTENTPYHPSAVPKKDLALLAEMANSSGLDASLIEAIRNTYLSME
jgi:3-hydroxyisobutyrate dehydrogenase-like beta-hydroxyacid dehydrogenase